MPFNIRAVAFHPHLHGVAGGAAVCAINVLADLGETGASGRVRLAGVELDRVLMTEFLEVLANDAVKGPGHDEENTNENHRSFVHRTTSFRVAIPQHAAMLDLAMRRMLIKNANWPASSTSHPSVLIPT